MAKPGSRSPTRCWPTTPSPASGAGQGGDATLDGFLETVAVDTARTDVHAGFGGGQGVDRGLADLFEVAQQAIGGAGSAAQGRHQEFIKLAPVAIVHHLAQFGAQLGCLAGGQGAAIVGQGMQLTRQRLQRRAHRGLFHRQGYEGIG